VGVVSRSPQYVELADRLAQRWGDLVPGTLVESEHQLAAEFGVNRLTAREAVRELERRMVVRRVMGRGTFVAHRLDYVIRIGGIASFHRNVEAAGHRPTTVIVDRRWVGRGTSRALTFTRVSYVDGLVAASSVDSFPADIGRLVDDAIVDGASIHQTLASLGYIPRRRSVRVAMAIPPPAHASALDFSSSVMPSWHVVSETVDQPAGVVVHESDAWMRTDMFEVTVIVEEPPTHGA
jgi:DNA-binding GntR family transcriptional regulator